MRVKVVKRVLGSILVGVIFGVLWVAPVVAVGNPTSVAIYTTKVFQNLFETGDQLYFVRYEVNYSIDPDESADETFLVVLYDTDGTTLLFQRPLNYYGHNIISIYLTSAQALTWGSEYILRVMGSPTIFDPLVEGTNMATRTLSPSFDYVAGAMSASRTSFGVFSVNTAEVLGTDWGIPLLSSGDLLNTQGAITFNAAVPGMYSIVPEIYQTAIGVPTLIEASRTITLEGVITGTFTAGETVTGGTSSVTSLFIAGSQTADTVQVTHTGVDLFVDGETVTGGTSGATIVIAAGGIVLGLIEEQALGRTGTRLRAALDGFGAWLGISGTAFGGLAMFILFITTAGFIFTSTGQVQGAILLAMPVVLFGNFIGLVPFVAMWMVVIVCALLFAILFIMGRVA